MKLCSCACGSVNVYYLSSDTTVWIFQPSVVSLLFPPPLPVLPAGYTSKVHYLSETHFCQEAAVRYFPFRRAMLVLNVEFVFVIWNNFFKKTCFQASRTKASPPPHSSALLAVMSSFFLSPTASCSQSEFRVYRRCPPLALLCVDVEHVDSSAASICSLWSWDGLWHIGLVLAADLKALR